MALTKKDIKSLAFLFGKYNGVDFSSSPPVRTDATNTWEYLGIPLSLEEKLTADAIERRNIAQADLAIIDTINPNMLEVSFSFNIPKVTAPLFDLSRFINGVAVNKNGDDIRGIGGTEAHAGTDGELISLKVDDGTNTILYNEAILTSANISFDDGLYMVDCTIMCIEENKTVIANTANTLVTITNHDGTTVTKFGSELFAEQIEPVISVVSDGQVEGIDITNGGSGYTTAPTITFTAAPAGGTTATALVRISGGIVVGYTITEAGSGYLTAPTITVDNAGSGGTGLVAATTITDRVASGATHTLPMTNLDAGSSPLRIVVSRTHQSNFKARSFSISKTFNTEYVKALGSNNIKSIVKTTNSAITGTVEVETIDSFAQIGGQNNVIEYIRLSQAEAQSLATPVLEFQFDKRTNVKGHIKILPVHFTDRSDSYSESDFATRNISFTGIAATFQDTQTAFS